MRTISATEANRQFSSLLHDAASGTVITVLSRGKAVATIGPASVEKNIQQVARAQLLDRLREQQPSGARSWTRDELYDD